MGRCRRRINDSASCLDRNAADASAHCALAGLTLAAASLGLDFDSAVAAFPDFAFLDFCCLSSELLTHH